MTLHSDRRLGAWATWAGLVCALLMSAPDAGAERPLDGAWQMGALVEGYTIVSWHDACGPKPTGGVLLSGGQVTVQSQGAELLILAGRTLRTDRCLDPEPSLVVTLHGATARAWSTECSSPANDPRRSKVKANYHATDQRIVLSETARYELSVLGGTCVAEARRSSILTRPAEATVSPSAAPSVATPSPSAPTPAPSVNKPPEVRERCHPGDTARIEVRPARKLARPGEKFVLRASAFDKDGCPTAPQLGFRLEGTTRGGPTVRPTGEVEVPADCPEGSYVVVVSLGDRFTRVQLEIVSPDRFDEARVRGSLDPTGESEEPVVLVVASSSLGSQGVRVASGMTPWRWGLVAVAAVVASGLGLVALRILRGRMRRGSDTGSGEMSLPPGAEAPASEGLRCHACHAVVPPGARYCPHDGTLLTHDGAVGGKVCPTCGTRYAASSEFCGRDGTLLVRVNG